MLVNRPPISRAQSGAGRRPRGRCDRAQPHGALADSSRNDYPAIALKPDRPYDSIREFYLYIEPSLLSAIGHGDRVQAMRLINHVLLHIYAAGVERSDLLKGLLLELVVMMSRAAVEAGSSQTAVLGRSFQSLTELAAVQDDEQLAGWLRTMLERVLAALERTQPAGSSGVIAGAIGFIRDNAHREVTRDEAARSVGVSPSHFSHLLHERTGLSFTALLRQARIDLACEMLLNTDLPLAEVAQRCGFYDQSHFTRTFAHARQVTPRRFREQSRLPHRPALQLPPG
jgi:AraC-like DNA-binding protein